jgi:histidine ammonia-lyase
MATFAARRLQAMVDNTASILGIELMAAGQGIDFLRPLQSSTSLERVYSLLRSKVPAMPTDRFMSPDIEEATKLVLGGAISNEIFALTDLPKLWVTVG